MRSLQAGFIPAVTESSRQVHFDGSFLEVKKESSCYVRPWRAQDFSPLW
jgi:hypothetical protein